MKDANPLELISNLLATLNQGAADQAVSMDMADLIERISSSGKAGEITLKFKFVPKGINNTNMDVSMQHSIKKPTVTPPSSTLYVGPGGTLSKTDPYAQKLPGMDKPTTKETTES